MAMLWQDGNFTIMDTPLGEPRQNDDTPKAKLRNAPNKRRLIGLIATIVLIVSAYFLRAWLGQAQLSEQNRRRAGNNAQGIPVLTQRQRAATWMCI
jgi:hypothetical protein